MAEVELECTVYGEGIVFPVKIARDAKVCALKKAIVHEKKDVNDLFKVDPATLTLYLARKNSVWLKDDDDLDSFLRAGVSTEYPQMRSTRKLNNLACFGPDFELGEERIYVLIELPPPRQPLSREFVVDGVNFPVVESMVLNPPALVAFWRDLKAVPTKIEADATFALPEGTNLLGDPTRGSRVYIRHCYPQLLNLCWEMIHDQAQETPHLVILGNPRIGITYFGYVILLHLARLGATVAYEIGSLKRRYLFTNSNVVIEGSPEAFIQILKNATTYYIVDAVKPPEYPAKTILLTSPRRLIWFEFNKTNCDCLYMPVWTWTEITNCRRLLYPHLDASIVSDLFRRYGGGAPRYVLEKARSSSQERHLEQALDSVDLDSLVYA